MEKKSIYPLGEDEGDPVFFITDLLPHLAKDQMERKWEKASLVKIKSSCGKYPFKMMK